MKWPVLLMTSLGCVFGTLLRADETKKFSYVDLQPKANQQLTDNVGSGIQGNNLANLPKGEQTLEEVKFRIADGFLQLHNALVEVAGATTGRAVRPFGLGVTVPTAICWSGLGLGGMVRFTAGCAVRTTVIVRSVGASVFVLARWPHPFSPVLRKRPAGH